MCFSLCRRGRLSYRQGNQVLFGGQAWDFPAGTSVEVVLEFFLKQGHGIKLQHSLLAGDKGFHHAKIPVLDAGDENEASYHVTFNDEAKGVNANLTVVQADDQAALLEVIKPEMIIDWP